MYLVHLRMDVESVNSLLLLQQISFYLSSIDITVIFSPWIHWWGSKTNFHQNENSLKTCSYHIVQTLSAPPVFLTSASAFIFKWFLFLPAFLSICRAKSAPPLCPAPPRAEFLQWARVHPGAKEETQTLLARKIWEPSSWPRLQEPPCSCSCFRQMKIKHLRSIPTAWAGGFIIPCSLVHSHSSLQACSR